jgi:hypothetical protein
MQSMPHPKLPGVFVTSPIYIAPASEFLKMARCAHQWPEGLPDNMEEVPGGYLSGYQKCACCGASRGIYKKQEPPADAGALSENSTEATIDPLGQQNKGTEET